MQTVKYKPTKCISIVMSQSGYKQREGSHNRCMRRNNHRSVGTENQNNQTPVVWLLGGHRTPLHPQQANTMDSPDRLADSERESWLCRVWVFRAVPMSADIWLFYIPSSSVRTMMGGERGPSPCPVKASTLILYWVQRCRPRMIQDRSDAATVTSWASGSADSSWRSTSV